MANLLKSGGALIIVIPEFRINAQTWPIPISPILPKELKLLGEWAYSRPEQKVVRHIYKLIRK
jgi:hypothetical protein